MPRDINGWRSHPLGLEEQPVPLRDPFRIILSSANLASPCCTRSSVSDHIKHKFTRDGVFAQRQQLFILRLAISTFSGSDTNQQRIRCQLCSHPSNSDWSIWQETIVRIYFIAKYSYTSAVFASVVEYTAKGGCPSGQYPFAANFFVSVVEPGPTSEPLNPPLIMPRPARMLVPCNTLRPSSAICAAANSG